MDIDRAVARSGQPQFHHGLDGMEDRVLARIAARPARTAAMWTTVGGAGFALLLGVGSVAAPARETPAVPFGVPGPLVPSTLLLGGK